jgi:hypothetical protein
MQMELTADEVKLLNDVLTTRLGDYSMQIADADDSQFQAQLRRERDLLQGIVQRLASN